jgi:hypothetical protein
MRPIASTVMNREDEAIGATLTLWPSFRAWD